MKTEIRVWDKKDKNGKFLTKEVEHDDLLPCPFCGGEAYPRISGDAWCIMCIKCYAKSGYQNLPARWNSKKCLDTHLINKAIKAWNERV